MTQKVHLAMHVLWCDEQVQQLAYIVHQISIGEIYI